MTVVFALLVLAVITMGVLMILKAPANAPASTDSTLRQPSIASTMPDPIGAADLRQVRFPVVFRGYRMDEVDALLARLAQQLPAPDARTAPEALTAPEARTAPEALTAQDFPPPTAETEPQ